MVTDIDEILTDDAFAALKAAENDLAKRKVQTL